MKIRCKCSINAYKIISSLNCLLEFDTHFFKFNINEKIPSIQLEILKGLFSPLNHNEKNEYIFNYSLILKIEQDKKLTEKIIIELINPVLNNTFQLILSDLNETGKIFTKKININLFVMNIEKSIKQEKKFLLLGFNNMIYALRDYLEKNKKTKLLENIKIMSYNFGKKYYEESSNTFKKNNEKIKKLNDVVLETKLKEIEMSLSQQERIKKSICYTNFESLLNEFNIRTTFFIEETTIVFFKIICIGTNTFDDIQFDKLNLNQLIQNDDNYNNNNNNKNKKQNNSFNSINPKNGLILTLNNNCNNNNNNVNSQKLEYSSTAHTSKKNKRSSYKNYEEPKIQTPKFKQFNYNNNNNSNIKSFTNKFMEEENLFNPLENITNLSKIILNKHITSLTGLNKEIKELCIVHSMVEPNDVFNLFCNASEVIHRKFFQLCISHYLGDIFYLEKDKRGIFKIEDFYNYFLYIRALKIYLFNTGTKENFISSILLGEEL